MRNRKVWQDQRTKEGCTPLGEVRIIPQNSHREWFFQTKEFPFGQIHLPYSKMLWLYSWTSICEWVCAPVCVYVCVCWYQGQGHSRVCEFHLFFLMFKDLPVTCVFGNSEVYISKTLHFLSWDPCLLLRGSAIVDNIGIFFLLFFSKAREKKKFRNEWRDTKMCNMSTLCQNLFGSISIYLTCGTT